VRSAFRASRAKNDSGTICEATYPVTLRFKPSQIEVRFKRENVLCGFKDGIVFKRVRHSRTEFISQSLNFLLQRLIGLTKILALSRVNKEARDFRKRRELELLELT
jgi:hypothetical protein